MTGTVSTRDKNSTRTVSQAILEGISPEGGLFVPREIPEFAPGELRAWAGKPYPEIAGRVLAKFLGDFTEEETLECVRQAYGGDRFENGKPAPVSRAGGAFLLELWHGPTCAFKDLALQILPLLLSCAAKKNQITDELVILTATSGDTGKAALEGFRDRPGVRVLVFYPEDGVSAMQKRQMQAQEGGNVSVCAIRGNFDDAQNGVKAIFTDPGFRERLAERQMRFTSANSINIGRLLPQVAYYVSAYCDLCADGGLEFGEPLNAAVPTGNFGNILAAYYAKRMGVPIGKLICASNRNNVLTDFIQTGRYDRNREFSPSLSPSMDILVSSNLERLLFELCGREDSRIRELMEALRVDGTYTVDGGMLERLREDFDAGFRDDVQTCETVRSVYERYGVLLDPHTAVAYGVWEEYRARTGDGRKTLVVSTASPYKFADSVCEALGIPADGADLFAPAAALNGKTGIPVPRPLERLRDLPPRLLDRCAKDGMKDYVAGVLGLAADRG